MHSTPRALYANLLYIQSSDVICTHAGESEIVAARGQGEKCFDIASCDIPSVFQRNNFALDSTRHIFFFFSFPHFSHFSSFSELLSNWSELVIAKYRGIRGETWGEGQKSISHAIQTKLAPVEIKKVFN